MHYPDYLDLPDRRLAVDRGDGAAPELVFLPGFRSDMAGAKAGFVAGHAASRGLACTRFDYRGHGRSSGRFEDGCIGDWLEDVLAVLERVVRHRAVLVGSSMGGWLALLAARARPGRVAGLVLVAPAPDFTARLIEPALTIPQRAALARDGVVHVPSGYGEPLPLSARLIEEGRRHLLLDAPLMLRLPVHILHGQQDPDVPWALSVELAGRLAGAAVILELVADGDHRLSREVDLKRLAAAIDRVVGQARPAAEAR